MLQHSVSYQLKKSLKTNQFECMKIKQIISRGPIQESLHNGRLFPSVCKDINNFNINILKSIIYAQ